MDLNQPLQKLVESVPGAISAALIDHEGEAITFYIASESADASEQVRLISAYHRIWFRDCVQISRKKNLGKLDHLIQKYESGSVVMKALKDDYAIVLLGTPEMYLGQGIFYLNEICEAINEDL